MITLSTLRMPLEVTHLSVMVCVAGDVMLDVLVSTRGPLRIDDDTAAGIAFSAGGQGANVAAWVCALGGRAGLYGPRTRGAAGQVIDEQLMARGIRLHGEPRDTHCGAVVSWLACGQRTLASDPGDPGWIDERLADTSWLAGADWLHLSGYLLLRAPDPAVVISAARAARQVGALVAVDLASAAMIVSYGVRAFRALVASIAPTLMFGNEREWDVVGGWSPDLCVDAVVKRGRLGSTFIAGGVHRSLSVVPGPVVDVTGAGDALAAGYLVGGPQVAMAAAAACVSATGAQPPSWWRHGVEPEGQVEPRAD
jgi:ribokinase